MRDNENGRTIFKLIAILVLIIIIILGGLVLLQKLWKVNNDKDIRTDLLYIQAKCKVIYDKHIINAEEPLIGEKINEFQDNEEINKIIVDSEKDWYILSQDDLNNIGADYLKSDNGYIVNYETEEIIYVEGFKEEEKTLYKLSDILEPKNEETENNSNDESVETEKNTDSNEEVNNSIENNEITE